MRCHDDLQGETITLAILLGQCKLIHDTAHYSKQTELQALGLGGASRGREQIGT